MKKKAEFQWDYSYFKWQDIPAQVRRQMVLGRSAGGRTWIQGRTSVLMDVHNFEARKLYNQNWDGCRDLWKEHYRQRKLSRGQPKDPRIVEFIRSCREQELREQPRRDQFSRQQQERYERWLKENKPD
jgi:hypothetical protein